MSPPIQSRSPSQADSSPSPQRHRWLRWLLSAFAWVLGLAIAGALALAHDDALLALAARTEVSGETVFFYTREARPLLDALLQHPHLRTLHRPANLEDLFLKLTGRQIREDG